MCDNNDFPQCDCDLHTNPIYTYAHRVGNTVTGACIIGGTVVRNSNWPATYVTTFHVDNYFAQLFASISLLLGANGATVRAWVTHAFLFVETWLVHLGAHCIHTFTLDISCGTH